mgnify:CR=1 FL=1
MGGYTRATQLGARSRHTDPKRAGVVGVDDKWDQGVRSKLVFRAIVGDTHLHRLVAV